jgi:hypothetical protein
MLSTTKLMIIPAVIRSPFAKDVNGNLSTVAAESIGRGDIATIP